MVGGYLIDGMLGVGVWVAGLHVFDGLHCILHAMLRSRYPALRWLASPHAMHHRWLDASLRIHPEAQIANFWGHIVLEYGTQLAFDAVVLYALPTRAIFVAFILQTAVFAYIVSQRGLDPNHRPIAMLDAYRPSVFALPAYHALHHVYPDAYYSAYTKLIDYLVGAGTMLRGRRFVVAGTESALGAALHGRLRHEGVAQVDWVAGDALRFDEDRLARTDVLVITDPVPARDALVEAFIRATRRRQLPPEVWAVHTTPRDGLARHYHTDPRVTYRTLVLPEAGLLDPTDAARVATAVLRSIRRGLNFVPAGSMLEAFRNFLAFRRTPPIPPNGVVIGAHRADLMVMAGVRV